LPFVEIANRLVGDAFGLDARQTLALEGVFEG
jgi:hypothetical protein